MNSNLLAVSLLALSTLMLPSQEAHADRTVQLSAWGGGKSSVLCESRNHRRVYCRANTRGGITLQRRLSKAPCQQGRTWGYDRYGIWVDRGCRAEFRLGERGTGQGVGGTMRCESRDRRRHFCAADTRGGVSLKRQLSHSACRQGDTWGYDRRGIWVDKGCRAEFGLARSDYSRHRYGGE